MNVLQIVTASMDGQALPTSTQQVLDQTAADAVIAANLAKAAALGYTVNADGSFTSSGVTVEQGYVEAAPFYDVPVHPMCGGNPPPPIAKAPDTWGLGTLKLFIWGQSMSTNNGRGRFTARTPAAWVYGGHGQFFAASDPIVGPDGTDGSAWSRLPDLLMGAPIRGTHINRVVIGCCSRGGTSINDWTAGGQYNELLTCSLTDYMKNVGMPDLLLFSQGEADVLTMTGDQWFSQWQAMLGSVRAVSCTSRIMTSVETICGLRDAANYPCPDVWSRGPDDFIARELGRQSIRAAQARAGVMNANTLPGPNLDLVDWRLRAAGDGCHFSAAGLDAIAQAWAVSIVPVLP